MSAHYMLSFEASGKAENNCTIGNSLYLWDLWKLFGIECPCFDNLIYYPWCEFDTEDRVIWLNISPKCVISTWNQQFPGYWLCW